MVDKAVEEEEEDKLASVINVGPFEMDVIHGLGRRFGKPEWENFEGGYYSWSDVLDLKAQIASYAHVVMADSSRYYYGQNLMLGAISLYQAILINEIDYYDLGYDGIDFKLKKDDEDE